jgi:hypothetical protein
MAAPASRHALLAQTSMRATGVGLSHRTQVEIGGALADLFTVFNPFLD